VGLPFVGNVSNTASENEYADVLFVCFDVENGQQIKSHAASGSFGNRKILAQAGISIFDPRNLPSTSSKEALKTYNFGLGGSPSHRRNVDRKFFFGETIWLSQLANLLTSMEKLLDRSRNIVLVGHGLNGDCQALRSLGFDFDSSIVGYIDTADAARTIFGPPSGQDEAPTVTTFRLKDLPAKLGLVVEGCHVAGNDANFTLRALLLLAVEGYRTSDLLNEPTKEILETIRAIGLESLPRLLPPPTSRAKKSVNKDPDAPIRCGGWIFFGHLLENPLVPRETTWAHEHHIAQQPESESTPKYADSRQSQSSDFRQPSALLLRWCPKLRNRRPKEPARPF
jgi:hypothetical protein